MKRRRQATGLIHQGYWVRTNFALTFRLLFIFTTQALRPVHAPDQLLK